MYRETKRCVDNVAGRSKVYAGIGIDIPGAGATFSSSPDVVAEAVRKAFEAGASGVLLSREYDEMRAENLRGAGRGVRDALKANGRPG